MSSQDGPDVADIVELYGSTYVDNCIALVAAALLVFEYLTTLGQEIRLFWARPARWASALFFFIRYWNLLNYVVLWAVSVAAANLSDETTVFIHSCALSVKAQFATTALQYIPWAVLSAMRVLALSGKNWLLSLLVFALSIGPGVTNLVVFGFGLTGAKVMTAGCLEQVDVTLLQHKMVRQVSLVSRTTLIAADFIVVVVTVHATWQRGVARVIPSSGSARSSLSDVLLYNGLMYFLVLLCLNILAVVLARVPNDAVVQQASYITNLSAPITAVFACRFLLDLQAADNARASFASELLSFPNLEDSMGFEVGVFGASTRHDSLLDNEHEYWDAPDAPGSVDGSDGTRVDGDGGSSSSGCAPAPARIEVSAA